MSSTQPSHVDPVCVSLIPDHTHQVRALFITAVVLASVGFLSKLAGAAGLSMFDPVKMLQSQLVSRVGGRLGAARVASVLNFLLDSLISLAVVLIAVAVGLMNGFFDRHADCSHNPSA